MAFVAPLPTVAARPRSRVGGVAVYWHLLSLDAPTVAVLWAWSLGRVAQTRVSAIALAVLGVGTWLIYVADRLLDARTGAQTGLRERHFFHARHRAVLQQGLGVGGALLLGLICIMPAAARGEDTLLFGASLIYFASVHLPALRVRRWFPREVAAGIIFALATAVPAWSAANANRSSLAGAVLLFAGLCMLNIVAIENWEGWPRATRSVLLPVLGMGVALGTVAVALAPGDRTRGEFGICAASLVSAVLLFALDCTQRSFERRAADDEKRAEFLLALRVAADAALLTPILFVAWLR